MDRSKSERENEYDIVTYWTSTEEQTILVDSGAPKSVSGKDWFDKYVKDNEIEEQENQCKKTLSLAQETFSRAICRSRYHSI